MESSGAVVAAQEVSSFPAAVAGVVIGGPAGSPGAPVRFPTPLFSILRFGRCQKSLDLLREIQKVISEHLHAPGIITSTALSSHCWALGARLTLQRKFRFGFTVI